MATDNADQQLERTARTTDALLRLSDAPSRARVALRLVDELGHYIDAAAHEAPEAPRWACASACNFCCHMPVVATVPELVRVAAAVTAHPEAASLRARLDGNERAIQAMDDEAELFESRLPCALLDANGRCSVYAARPLACRGHVSFSREVCEAAYAGTGADDADPGDPVMQQARTNADTHLAASLIVAGLDGMGYELHSGLTRALELGEAGWSAAAEFEACRRLSSRVEFDLDLRAVMDEF